MGVVKSYVSVGWLKLLLGAVSRPLKLLHSLLSSPLSVRYLLLGTHQIPLHAFEGSLKSLGETEMDLDEVQCIVANLIDKVCVEGVWVHGVHGVCV